MKATRAKTGRPSKGPRRYVNAPVAQHAADQLARYAELTGEGMGPTLARIFEAHIDDLNLEQIEARAAQQAGQARMELDDLSRSST